MPKWLERMLAKARDKHARGVLTVRNAAEGGVLDLEMYGDIGPGWWGEEEDEITAKAVRNALQAAGNVSQINVRLNSLGGDVFEGVAIYNLLKAHAAPVHVTVDGIAASIASVIAIAGDTVTMGKGTFLMIHRAWSLAIGNAKDMLETAAILEKLDGQIATFYEAKSGKPSKDYLPLMEAETWFTPEEAVEQGLADEVAESQSQAKALAGDLRFYGFERVPEDLVNEVEAVDPPDEPEPTPTHAQGEEHEPQGRDNAMNARRQRDMEARERVRLYA